MSGIDLRLDNIGIVTSSLDDSLAFYRRLGFEVIEHDAGQGYAAARLAGTVLYLFRGDNDQQIARSGNPAANPGGVDHLSFATPDVDETYRALSGMGVDFFLAPEDAPWGARVCGCYDPSGIPTYFLRWAQP
jgi:catechol 2,3-dioxygenase-like lactoylglutathione lyase family enzyme